MQDCERRVDPARTKPDDLERYKIRQEVVGPKHDPYSRASYKVWMKGHGGLPTADLQVDALALSNRIWIDGREIPRPAHMKDPANWNKFTEWLFEGLTGVRPSDLEEWTAESVEQLRDVRAAELAAGWDPTP